MSIKGKHPLVVKTKRGLLIALLAAALVVGTNLVNGQEGETALVADAKLVNGQECEDAQALARQQRAGQRVFEKETFGGNGRVCSTCHRGSAGTFAPEQARASCLRAIPMIRSFAPLTRTTEWARAITGC